MEKADIIKRHAVFNLPGIITSFIIGLFLFLLPVFSYADPPPEVTLSADPEII